jgi:hypothetical protein
MKINIWLIIHTILFALIVISPFVINWKIITILVVANYLVFGAYYKHCPLTKLQFGNTNQGFVQYYLRRIGIPLTSKQQMILMRYVVPIFIVAISIIWQIILKR